MLTHLVKLIRLVSLAYMEQLRPLRARKTMLALVLCIIFSSSSAQENYTLDSLIQIIQQHKQNDSTADALFRFVLTHRITPDKAIEATLAALPLYEAQGDRSGQSSCFLLLQGAYRDMGQYETSLKYAKNGLALAGNSGLMEQRIWRGQRSRSLFLAELGQTYLLLNQLDSAEYYTRAAVAENELRNGSHWNFPIYLLATIQTIEGRNNEAENNFRKAYSLAIQNKLAWDTLQIYSGMSTLFRKMGKLDSSLKYAQIVVQTGYGATEIKNTLESVDNLIDIHRQNGNKDSILKYLDFKILVRDSLMSIEQDRKILQITFNEHLKEQEIENRQRAYQNKIRQYSLVAGLIGLALFSFLLWRNNRQKQQSKEKIEKAYNELKNTQQQLIHAEKMASLGELTAGIAHEIQNPLNFVNNFAETSKELLDEMKTALVSGDHAEATAIAGDVILNLEKIRSHGNRADSIVKGMLQHSRSNSGVKEPTDINALADEYLRLAYHGLRAKNASFNALTKTEFDQSIGNINIIPQDMGRVLLNMINNAFYAVDEKKKQMGDGYNPEVTVSTRLVGFNNPASRTSTNSPIPSSDKSLIISVRDNGNGIPPEVQKKIFQPFFTTKPTGQGTGLGLSLSYDIIKAHGGEIKVNSKPGEGTEFRIVLPI